jgi:hypothetical protein
MLMMIVTGNTRHLLSYGFCTAELEEYGSFEGIASAPNCQWSG